jgi:F-type H+-transporting ATPase subunit b
MKYVWPPIIKAINERQKKIADGLEAAEKGKQYLELSRENSLQIISNAKSDAAGIISAANEDVVKIVEDGKVKANEEAKRIIELAKIDIEKERLSAGNELRKRAGKAALIIAEKIMRSNVNTDANYALVEQLISEVDRD